MVTTGALIHGDRDRFLRFNAPEEHPIALQLGGSDPKTLAECAKMAEDYGYDEVNLNCGCPSDRVQSGFFGACLMAEPDLVAECFSQMQAAVKIPATIKCRIAIDEEPEELFLRKFIETLYQAGCRIFIIHARKAWLKGLSPKQNREVPPLNYDLVYQIKKDYPDCLIILNGGIKTVAACQKHLDHLDGIMIGREAYQNPLCLVEMEQAFFNSAHNVDYTQIIAQMSAYAQDQYERYGTPVKSIARHMTGFMAGQRGAKYWRQQIAERAFKEDASANLFNEIWHDLQSSLAP